MDSSDHPWWFPSEGAPWAHEEAGAPSEARGPDHRLGVTDRTFISRVGGVVSDDERWRLQVLQLDRLLAQVDDARASVFRERRGNRYFSAWTPARGA
jgi:hypothetical protein